MAIRPIPVTRRWTFTRVSISIPYGRDGQLKVIRGPIFRKLKFSGSEYREQKKVTQNMHFNLT
jgi:hypothetical protein